MKEIDIDSFAGGGGASVGIEAATGRPVDVAINHDAEAIAMHRANHPHTVHYIKDIWQVSPAEVVAKHGPVRLAWFSPDCTHHSKAKGRAPIRDAAGRRSRDLAWVVVEWARVAKPRIIMLENVEEFRGWGPLIEDGRACPDRRGETFALWIAALRREGYRVEWRELRACDYGAPTIRKRLFVVARRDGKPITWPAPTHGKGLLSYRTAAECIDWSIPVHSIFLTKEEGRKVGCKRPLAEATMRRIARGVWKYVINAKRPFIVPITHTKSGDLVQSIDEPLRTVTTAKGGEFAVVAPYMVPRYGERAGQEPRTRDLRNPAPTIVPTGNGGSLVAAHIMPYRGTKKGGKPRVRDIDEPIHTVTCEPSAAVVAAYLAQHNTGMLGRDARTPVSTIVTKGCTQNLVTAHLTRQFGASVGQACDKPAPTTTAGGGGKTGAVVAFLSRQFTGNTNGGQGDLFEPTNAVLASGQHQALVEAFLVKYYGTAIGAALNEPAPTATTHARFGLVTVEGVDYQIVDIGMRMLAPKELYAAQGFPASYEIAPVHRGRPLTKTMQIRMCGNSVCPQVAEALVRANMQDEIYGSARATGGMA